SRLLGSKPGLIAPGLREGETVSSAGDINGDGVDDVIIGSGLEGRAYIVFGRDTASGAVFPVEIELTDLDGSDGFRLVGSGSRIAVALAGDFNGDGVDDVIVSDPFADSTGSGAGTSFIVFGRSAGAPAFPAVLDLSSLDGETGIRIEAGGESESFGGRVAGAGDVNNDGIDDVVISGGGSADHVVRAYVLFGSTARFP